MSLLVWLPLTKDLTNQGLSDATFSYVNNNGKLSLNASGKLGSCYERTASGYADLFRSSTTFNLSGDLSMCCWACVSATIGDTANGLITNHNHADNTSVGITVKQVSTTDYRICCSTGTGSSRTYNTYYGTTNIKDAWHHLALTYTKSTKVLQLWVDGVVEYTLNNYANASSNNAFELFNWSTGYGGNAQFRPVCKLNDVRLYDHCLSAKEVKEIVKGLVCHYQLNNDSRGGLPNILTNSTGYQGVSDWSGVISIGSENNSLFLIAQRTNTTSTGRTFVTHTAITSLISGWVAGDKFTISGYYKVPSNETYAVTANMFIRWTHKSGESTYTDTGFSTPSASAIVKDTWIRFEYTYSVPANYQNGGVNFYLSAFSQGLSTVYWKNIKLEKGDKATAWIPAATDNLYSTLGYNENIVYDSSGLNNHMTAYGSPTISTNTVRNSVSTHFINDQYALAQANANTYLPKDAITVNLWMNCSTWGNPISCTQSGGWNFENGSAGIQFSCYISDVGYKVAHSGIATSTLLNAWHMLTGVFDGTSVKIYIDAELKATTVTGSTNGIGYAANRLVISGEAAGATPASSTFVGEISDVRIYATPLSEEDIKALYNTPVSISNTGAMFTQGEFVEV